MAGSIIEVEGYVATLAMRFATARLIAWDHGVHLVDWICWDDDAVRSMRMALDPADSEWCDAPS